MEKFTLRKKWRFLTAYILYFAIGYGLTGRVLLFEPRALPLLAVEEKIPLLPWTVWVYFSEYAFFFILVALVKEIELLKKMVLAFFFCFTISFLIFIFFPTLLLRPTLVPQDISSQVLTILWMIDRPLNCFPSLHVALVFMSSFVFFPYNRKISSLFLLWSVLISLSTLTTKQHYILDVWGGIGLAILVVPFSSWYYAHFKGWPFFKRGDSPNLFLCRE